MSNQSVRYTTKAAWRRQFDNPWFAKGYEDARERRPFHEYTMDDCSNLSSKKLEDWEILRAVQRYYEYGRYWHAVGLEWPLGPGGGLRRWVMAAVKAHWRDIIVQGEGR